MIYQQKLTGVNEEIENVTTENPEVLAQLITVAEEAHQTHDAASN